MLEILPAKITDSELILKFIYELATFEEFPYEISVTRQDLENNLLVENADAEAVICYVDNQACGFAVFYHSFSTTTGKRGLHLDDLYIQPDYQGQGIGKQVLIYLAELALKRQCARFEWWALNTNDAAIKFYLKLGAKKLSELSIFRLDIDGIANLAADN